MPTTIKIVAAIVFNDRHETLLVRKRGTSAFMQPGSKIDPGEDKIQALHRELQEEVGCKILPNSIHHVDDVTAIAANETNTIVEATLYECQLAGTPEPQAEIEEQVWVNPSTPTALNLAPLTADHVLPYVRKRTTGQK